MSRRTSAWNHPAEGKRVRGHRFDKQTFGSWTGDPIFICERCQLHFEVGQEIRKDCRGYYTKMVWVD